MEQKWIVIADGSKAHIYAYQGPQNKLKLVEGGRMQHINQPSRELVSTKRGRMHDNGQGQRSALERPTDPHEHEKQVFARKITEFLDSNAQAFDSLILVASPKILGALRQLLPEPIKHKVTAELDKDLTNTPENELPEHLQSVLRIDNNPRNIPQRVRRDKPHIL